MIITRPIASVIMLSKRLTILDSEGVVPSTSELVESLNNKSIPFFPHSANLIKSNFSPISVQSNLKSPVMAILVLSLITSIIKPKAPGIEWVTRKKLTRNSPTRTTVSS